MTPTSSSSVLDAENPPNIETVQEDGFKNKSSAIQENRRKALTLSQFTRLLTLLRDEEDLRSGWIKSQQGLTKKELDAKVTSRSFWKRTVAPAYNDSTITPFVVFPDHIEDEILLEFDGIEKTGAELEDSINKFKVSLNPVMNKYTASGQNDFQWYSFLIAGGSEPSSLYTKKLFVAGFILGIGVSNDHIALLGLMSRSMDGSGEAPMEAGMGNFDCKSPSVSRFGSRRNSRQRPASGEFEEKQIRLQEKWILRLTSSRADGFHDC